MDLTSRNSPYRLVVVGRIYELGNKNVELLLDSGTPSIVLFTTLNTSTLVSGESSSYSLGVSSERGSLVDPQSARFLRLGEKVFVDPTVPVPRGKIPPMDVNGLLPTALFRSIFISHSGRFVIFDPATNAALGQVKARASPGCGYLCGAITADRVARMSPSLALSLSLSVVAKSPYHSQNASATLSRCPCEVWCIR